MTWSCSQEVEDALWEAARAELPDQCLKTSVLTQAIVDRSRRYTSERDALGQVLSGRSGDAELAARALFFTVADAAKIQIPLAELERSGLLPAGELRVLDVGAGVGAMTLGIASRYPGRKLVVDAVDRDARALALFRHAARVLGENIALSTHTANIGTFDGDAGYDLVVAGTVLNELSSAARMRAVSEMLGQIGARGSVILIEPALRDCARALHELRDHILGAKTAHVFSPCVRTAVPCPALVVESDWCHEDRPTRLPSKAMDLSRRTHLRDAGLKFSYLVLRKDEARQVDKPGAGRVVSRVRKLKGKYECFLCSDRGRQRISLLKRDRTDANRSLVGAARGDVVVGVEESRVLRNHSVTVHALGTEADS